MRIDVDLLTEADAQAFLEHTHDATQRARLPIEQAILIEAHRVAIEDQTGWQLGDNVVRNIKQPGKHGQALVERGYHALGSAYLAAAANANPASWVLKVRATRARTRFLSSQQLMHEYESIAAAHPQIASVRARFALALCESDALEKGLSEASVALALDADNEVAYLARGLCLIKARKSEAAIKDLCAALAQNPKRRRTYLALARVLLDFGRHDALVALAQTMRDHRLNAHSIDIYVARSHLRQGNLAAGKQAFDTLFREDTQCARVLNAATTEAFNTDALGYYRDIVISALTAAPTSLDSYEAAALYVTRVRQDPEIEALIHAAPADLKEQPSFQLRVLLPIYRKAREVGLAGGIVDQCDRAGLSEIDAFMIASARIAYVTDGTAHDRLNEILERFPSSRKGHRLKISTLLRSDRVAAMSAKANAAAAMTPQAYRKLLLVIPSTLWDLDETLSVIDDAVARGRGLPIRHRRNLLEHALAEKSPDLIKSYLRLTDVNDAWCRSVGALLTSRLGAGKQPTRAATTLWQGIPADPNWGQLAGHARQLHAQVTRKQDTGHVLMDIHECPAEARKLVDILQKRITDKTPTSVIRLGDGEGNFLPYLATDRQFMQKDRRAVQQDPWWGQQLIADHELDKFAHLMVSVATHADILGVPQFSRLLSLLVAPEPTSTRDRRGVNAAIHLLDQLPSPPVLTSCNLHVDLQAAGLYETLFSHLDSVSVVSCLDLNGVLADRFGLSIRQDLRIPGEFRFLRELDQLTTQDPKPIYPDVYYHIMDRLNPSAGEVYLIGAGFLGKMMCQTIKERGGIALDLGSIFDFWCGAYTRKYHSIIVN